MKRHDDSPTSPLSDRARFPQESRSNADRTANGICPFESFEYHPDEHSYRALFDADEINPSEAAVGAVSLVAERDPLDVAVLGSEIDADALNTLLTPRQTCDGDVHVTFAFDDYEVSMSSYGSVTVHPQQSGDRSTTTDSAE